MNDSTNFGFWKLLEAPVYVLAPMANVTDAAFRRVIATYGKPDVFFTEFVSADGLCHPDARERLLLDLQFSEIEKPIVAQIFSAHPDKIEETAALCRELGFDGIDINMGCPDKAVNKQGAGAALAKNYELAQEIIRAAKRGAGDVPVSVKIRLGDTVSQIEEWIPALLEARPAVITVHGRTRKDMSKVPARWEEIAQSVEIRNEWSDASGIAPEDRTLIFGNGDVKDLDEADSKVKETGVDGVMLGRAIFGNPWLFNRGIEREGLSESERLGVMLEHAELFSELLGDEKPFHIMRKHFGAYVSGFHHAKEIRELLMQTESIEDARAAVRKIQKELLA